MTNVFDYPFSGEDLKKNFKKFRVALHKKHGGKVDPQGYEFAMYILHYFHKVRQISSFKKDVTVSLKLGPVFTCEGEAPYFYPDTLTVNEDIVRGWGFTDDDLADTYKYTKEYRCVKGTTM